MNLIAKWSTPIRGLAGGGWLVDTIQSLADAVQAGYHREHNSDDTHRTIHATGAIYERERTVALGDAVEPPFNASVFSANGTMTWTVVAANVSDFSYTRLGSYLLLTFAIASTTVAGAANTALQLLIPESLVGARDTFNAVRIVDNGTAGAGYAYVAPMSPYVEIHRNDAGNWGTGAGNNAVQGQILFEVRTQ